MALVNVWHLRKVAEASAKPCDICYKSTTSVLITPDNKDHFYVCPGHLKDRGFCMPVIDEAEVAAKKKKEDLDREIELIKKEYEEKMKKKKTKDKKGKEKEKEKDEGKDDKDKDLEAEKAEKEKDAKIKELTNKESPAVADDVPRIYTLQKVFHQKRLDRIRNAEVAKRNKERLKNPTMFPSVPTNKLG